MLSLDKSSFHSDSSPRREDNSPQLNDASANEVIARKTFVKFLFMLNSPFKVIGGHFIPVKQNRQADMWVIKRDLTATHRQRHPIPHLPAIDHFQTFSLPRFNDTLCLLLQDSA